MGLDRWTLGTDAVSMGTGKRARGEDKVSMGTGKRTKGKDKWSIGTAKCLTPYTPSDTNLAPDIVDKMLTTVTDHFGADWLGASG